MVLLETTPSVKTRLQIATEILGPRCADPTAATVVVDSFRFAAEKETVRLISIVIFSIVLSIV